MLFKDYIYFTRVLWLRFVVEWMNEKSLGHTRGELICRARENTTRRGQTVKGLNAIHLLTCSRCAWLMSSSFGGEHMSTAAVPPWIGSDCVLANCIPGSQAKSEWSELSHFWYKHLLHSTWFTCLFCHTTIHTSQNSTWLRRSLFSDQRCWRGDPETYFR